MTPDTTYTDLALLDALRERERQLAALELAVAEHFGFDAAYAPAPPYHVLMQWLSGKGGADAQEGTL